MELESVRNEKAEVEITTCVCYDSVSIRSNYYFFVRLVSHASIRVGVCSSGIFKVGFIVIKLNSHLKGLLHTYDNKN